MSNDISIANLPHVMERIASYLERRDRLACALVSKAFHKEFGRLLWRVLVFQRRSFPSESITEHDRLETLRINSPWTRKLVIDTHCRAGVMSSLSESCFLLRDLQVFVSRSNQADSEAEKFLPVIELITKNTHLSSCSIIRYADLSSSALGKLARALSNSPCLTELVLELRVSPPPRGWLQYVLQNLPKTLKALSLLWRRSREGDDGSESFPAKDWPESYPNLKVAKLLTEVTEQECSALAHFLRRCPALEDCTVPQMASAQDISNLIRLLGTSHIPFSLARLDCRMWKELDNHQWDRLLFAMQRHIRSFVIGIDFDTPPTMHYVREMTRSWSQTLESVHIYNSHLITSQDIQLILTTCPKLKKFDCICYWLLMIHQPQDADSKPLPGLAVNEESSAENGGMADWACMELEELRLTFADGRRVNVTETVAEQQEQRTARGIKRVYQQLGRLKKLRELTIGWCSGSMFSKGANLDISLDSGLGHMEGMISLTYFDIYFISRLNIGVAEAEWMLKNWPSLTRIGGLRCRYPLAGADADEPDYITTLRRRPFMSIE
ncbi:MAG: hypothetical protein J3Q66DRAFT_396397 [Benniella sp.]|nr:MAG: hypothetical protein J3Q66DRAFT_396397 [Benniella sp.]